MLRKFCILTWWMPNSWNPSCPTTFYCDPVRIHPKIYRVSNHLADRVAMQDASAQTAILQFMLSGRIQKYFCKLICFSAGLNKTTVPTTSKMIYWMATLIGFNLKSTAITWLWQNQEPKRMWLRLFKTTRKCLIFYLLLHRFSTSFIAFHLVEIWHRILETWEWNYPSDSSRKLCISWWSNDWHWFTYTKCWRPWHDGNWCWRYIGWLCFLSSERCWCRRCHVWNWVGIEKAKDLRSKTCWKITSNINNFHSWPDRDGHLQRMWSWSWRES